MTNEECIKMLKSKLDGNTDTSYEWCECVRLAIKALEQLQEKPEYIDIWNVGAILRNVPEQPDICKIYGGVCGYPIEACSECLKHEGWRPSKEQTRWIPVSKELPEENIHVLCQFYMGGMAECYHAHGAWHIVGGYRISCDEVVAWMPLPQPYAESEEWE